ncbi:MAG: hypothetical protein ACREGR_02640, partial [Minisyncoccia bacterium]
MPKNERVDQLNAQHSVPIDSRVSISLHPDSLLPHGDPLVGVDATGLGARVYVAGRQALSNLYGAMTTMEDAHRALLAPAPAVAGKGGGTRTLQIPENRKPELAAAMGNAFARAARVFDSNAGDVRDAIANLTGRIEQALENPQRDRTSVAAVASEIRGMCHGLPKAERFAFALRAIDDGDNEVASAILQTTPWASGLERNEWALLKDHASRVFAGADYAQREQASKVLEK